MEAGWAEKEEGETAKGAAVARELETGEGEEEEAATEGCFWLVSARRRRVAGGEK